MAVEAGQTQMALNLRLGDDATLENFAGLRGNAAALSAVQAMGTELVFLHGPTDGGKSHLLQAMCHRQESDALYLPAAEVLEFPAAEVLSGAEFLSLVCIDGVEQLAGRPDWEQALFNLYNRAAQRHCRLCFAAQLPPAALPLQLPDLRSRLAGGLVFALPAPDDAARREILLFRSARRGLRLSPEAATYILSRAGRGLGELLGVLERLDGASLAAKRSLTLPFVREVLDF